MNKSFYTRIGVSLLVVLLFLVSSCQPPTQSEPGAQPEEPAQPSVETEAPPQPPTEPQTDTLSIKVIQYDIGASEDRFVPLQEAANRIGAEMSLSIDVEVLLLANNPDGCNAAAIMYSDSADLYMQDSICASHAFATNSYASVPEDLVANLDFYGSGQSAFSDPPGNWWAAPFGTSPMMLIYNPELLGDLPEAPKLSDVMERGNDFPLTFPPHGAIALAMAQSYLTEPFTELSLLSSDFYAQLNGLAEIVDQMAADRQIRSTNTQEILSGFMNGDIAWTVQDLMFLRMLKMSGYDGPLAVAALPQINRFGGSAMGIAWVVPGDSPNQDLAWEFVSRLAVDPGAIEWLIANGFVPFYEAGYQEFASQREQIGEPWLPAALIANDRNFEILRSLAVQSTVWSLPAAVPVDTYNGNILPTSMNVIGNIANGESSMVDGLDNWVTFLRDIGILQ